MTSVAKARWAGEAATQQAAIKPAALPPLANSLGGIRNANQIVITQPHKLGNTASR